MSAAEILCAARQCTQHISTFANTCGRQRCCLRSRPLFQCELPAYRPPPPATFATLAHARQAEDPSGGDLDKRYHFSTRNFARAHNLGGEARGGTKDPRGGGGGGGLSPRRLRGPHFHISRPERSCYAWSQALPGSHSPALLLPLHPTTTDPVAVAWFKSHK